MFKLFVTFFLIGLLTFGGGYAMFPHIESKVLEYGWLTYEELHQMIAIAESTPGPFAINISTFIGQRLYGFWGSVVATLGVVLPSFIIILLIATILSKLSKNKVFNAIINGIKAVTIGLILATAITILLSYVLPDFAFTFEGLKQGIIFLIILFVYFMHKIIFKKKLNYYIILIIGGLLGLASYFI